MFIIVIITKFHTFDKLETRLLLITDRENINKVHIGLLERRAREQNGKQFSKSDENYILTNPRSSAKPK